MSNMHRFVFWSLAVVSVGQICPDFDLPSEAYVLRYNSTDPSATITIPVLPDELDKYSYATENALLAIPAQCATEFASKLTSAADLRNRFPCDPQGMKYLRVSDLEGGWTTVKEMKSCSKGLVVGFHGSGGPGWGQTQYGIIFAGMDYVHMQLDSMAMPEAMGLKGRTPVMPATEITLDEYCGPFTANEGTCGGFNQPYCYSTYVDAVLIDSTMYRKYVEGVYQIRKREMDYFVREQVEVLNAFSKVFAVGNSEGAMVLNRYYHASFHSVLSGLIFDGWSCEFNYFLPCQNAANVCEDKCDKTIPVLNLIGDKDEFFGAEEDSKAQRIAANTTHGYGNTNLKGNCHAQFEAQGFEKRTTVIFKGAWHTPKYWNDNLARAAVADFIGDHTHAWKSAHRCTEDASMSGLFECPEATRTCPAWEGHVNTTTCECGDCTWVETDSLGATYSLIGAYWLLSFLFVGLQ